MLPSYLDMLAILGMASATYFTRICGYLWLRKHQLSARARAVLESSPCCVMVSVVAPSFMTTDPKTLVALLCHGAAAKLLLTSPQGARPNIRPRAPHLLITQHSALHS